MELWRVAIMIRWLLLITLCLHGLIHLMGLAKAFDLAAVQALTKPISKPMGLTWALGAMLFLFAAILLFRHSDPWWMPALAALITSQVLIMLHWHDARFGTIANVLVLLSVVAGASVWSFRNAYRDDIVVSRNAVSNLPTHVLNEGDVGPLPLPVQRFIRASGGVGKPVPRTITFEFKGDIRSKGGPWMPFTTTQVNTFDPPTRAFWMDATMKGLPTKGYHRYNDGEAHMRIKVLGTFPVIDISSAELDTAETVTWFNDLCLFAPGALIDKRITWEAIDDHRARALIVHKGISISAELVFDAQDRLVNFISNDRYYLEEDKSMTRCRFSTPARDHRVENGVLVPGYAKRSITWPMAISRTGGSTCSAFATNENELIRQAHRHQAPAHRCLGLFQCGDLLSALRGDRGPHRQFGLDLSRVDRCRVPRPAAFQNGLPIDRCGSALFRFG